MWEGRFGLRGVVRGGEERGLGQPEEAMTGLLGGSPVLRPEARVRAARASAATGFAGGFAAGDEDGEGEDGEKLGDGFHIPR